MDKSKQTPTLFDVVTTYNHLRVEDYQRTYSWKSEQIEEFLLDISDSTESKATHFFGTLILQESMEESSTATVVDGQQRLTTSFIFVAYLRDKIRGLKSDIIPARSKNERDERVVDKALDFLCFSKQLNDYRFESSRFLKTLLTNVVLSEPKQQKPVPSRDNTGKKVTRDFRKAIAQIREWIETDLKKYEEELDKLQRINDLLDSVLDKFLVLKVTTNTLDESLDIFLTLNNRGLPLGPSDLVRGKVMSILSSGLKEAEQVKLHHQILDDWTNVVEEVGDPETFLRHYLVSTSKNKIQKKKVVSEVTDRINAKEITERQDKAKKFWEELQEEALIYSNIMEPRMGGDCQYRLELLEGLGKSHRILLLAVLNWKLSDQDRDEIVRLIFVLAFRNVIAGLNAQKLEDFYQEQAFLFREKGDCKVLRKSLHDRVINIEIDIEKYLSTDGDSGFVGRALLHAVNRATSKGANHPHVGSSDSHLEHVAPQTENEHWSMALYGNDSEAKKNYESDISRIGNLTLLDKGLNVQIQRKPFSDKKESYLKSNFAISRDLQDLPVWNMKVINQRTQWLSEMFHIFWAVDASTDKMISFTDWLR